MTTTVPRSPNGRLHPSVARRRKVLFRCSRCGNDLVKGEVEYRDGELTHAAKIPRCGPVQFQLNPTYQGRRRG